MTADKQEYPAEVVCGIAKKMGIELEKLPLETHHAVVGMLTQLFQHRGMAEQNRLEREKLRLAEEREKREAETNIALQQHAERSRTLAINAAPAPVRSQPIVIEEPAGVGA